MSKFDQTLGDVHKSESGTHRTDSISNQQIWSEGKQVGAVENVLDKKVGIKTIIVNDKGEEID